MVKINQCTICYKIKTAAGNWIIALDEDNMPLKRKIMGTYESICPECQKRLDAREELNELSTH